MGGLKKHLIVIAGPTAAGKTDIAVTLAQHYLCPVVSADSRQVYKELGIGVAKPSEAQLNAVQHYFIDLVSIHQDYNAGMYGEEARQIINRIFKEFDIAIVCGGTGLYIRSIFSELDKLPGKDENLRAKLKTLLETEGIASLQQYLLRLNPDTYSKTEILNPQRLMRAIEIAEAGGTLEKGTKITHPMFDDVNIIRIGISPERETLYRNINHRVDMMLEAGLEAEARALFPYHNLNALQTVGYSEWFPYFEGRISYDETVNLIKQHTRQYAKRQLTWFRNQEDLIWFDSTQSKDILQYLSKAILLQHK